MLAAIALGANLPSRIGPPEQTVRAAMLRLAELGTVMATSQLRTTEPVGYLDQPAFVNAAAVIETELAPLTLLSRLLAMEQEFGRDRAATPAKGPRTLDLDLILYGDLVLNDPELTLPHPSMHERRFVLEPLAEIAPAMRDPRSGHTMLQLLARLAEASAAV